MALIEYTTKVEILKGLKEIVARLDTIIKQNKEIIAKMDGERRAAVNKCDSCAHRYWHDPECSACNERNGFLYYEKM